MPTAIRRIKRPKLTETVADRLAVAIRKGDFAPGEMLPTERELGERFGVSRNVVREAVNELRTRGLVSTRQGSGSVVSDDIHKPVRRVMEDLLTGRDGAEGKLIELRRTLEVHIAELAAERATEADIRGMEALLSEFDAAGGDLGRCAGLDVAFHRALCRAAHNELFGVVVEPLNELLTATRRRALQRSGMEEAARSHRALLEAIRSRDAAGATRCMTEHMDLTLEGWRKTREGL